MKLNLLAFGIAKDIVSSNALEIELKEGASVAELKTQLYTKFPAFRELRSLAIAVNQAYQNDDYLLSASDEVVIIPPVSGG